MNAPTMTQLDTFTRDYINCALWSSTDEDGEPMDAMYGIDDLAPEALEKIITDCTQFQEAYAELLENYEHSAGHDFWLTRNHHGAGFWDRGAGEIGDKLTEAAHAEGSCDLYAGDDGKLYVS